MMNSVYQKALEIYAATIPANSVGIPTPNDTNLIQGLLNLVYFCAGAAAVIVIIVGGFWYVTGGDNPQQVQKGKNAIVFASAGLVIVLLAFGITGFVAGRF